MNRHLALFCGLALLVGSQAARAEVVAVIGSGQVGSALGQRLASLGHEVIYGSREPDRPELQTLVEVTGPRASANTQSAAAARANIVILAVPWEVAEDLAGSLGDLSGKIVVDPTNPRSTDDDGFRDYAFDGSNAERIQQRAIGAKVVKAFSTLGAETMLNPASAGGPVSLPIAGDDAQAKAAVASLASEMGLLPVDVGPLRFAHVIEGLHFLRYNAGFFGPRFNYFLRPEVGQNAD